MTWRSFTARVNGLSADAVWRLWRKHAGSTSPNLLAQSEEMQERMVREIGMG